MVLNLECSRLFTFPDENETFLGDFRMVLAAPERRGLFRGFSAETPANGSYSILVAPESFWSSGAPE
jgi:hypothetical protein